MPIAFSIPRRFSGPQGSANGGVGAGIIAVTVGEDVTVRLVRPLPLETDLTVAPAAPGRWEVHAGDDLVAAATAAAGPLDLGGPGPKPPTLEEARRLATRYAGLSSGRSIHCFVCGAARAEGD